MENDSSKRKMTDENAVALFKVLAEIVSERTGLKVTSHVRRKTPEELAADVEKEIKEVTV